MLIRATWPLVALAAASLAAQDCPCGYAATIDGEEHLFDEVVETDFTRLEDAARSKSWKRLEYTRTGRSARGPLGERYMPENVFTVPRADEDDSGAAKGLRLRVGGTVDDGMVPSAEVDSVREDVMYGTFRASMKLPRVPGTCAAFFWYFNDTQEMDIEFLTREFDRAARVFPVHLVTHSLASADPRHDPLDAGTHQRVELPFDPSGDFHEYRIDYLADDVVFYADGAVLGRMNGSPVPSTAGHLILQHWSSGEPLWSGGPPEEDVVLGVRYVKAYFNTGQRASRCDGSRGVCRIPELAAGHFFTDQDHQDAEEDDEDGSSPLVSLELRTVAGMALAWLLL